MEQIVIRSFDHLQPKVKLATLWLVLWSVYLQGATLPAGFTESPLATGLSSPTAMEFAPDGRLFVCEQGGQLRVIKNGVLLSTPFLSVSVDLAGERGLLGVAFHPNFSVQPYVYVYYTTLASPKHNRVSRFTANGDVAAFGSEVVIMDLENLSGATNHNGGGIHFGTDGRLYVAVGENATSSNAQTFSNRLGKMLRVNPDGSIPLDNPFYNTASGVNRAIWALGLRNPFTFAFQPGTGRLFINDVGNTSWEEINEGVAGANYGWPATEGYTTNMQYRSPLYAYAHGASPTTGCAITGGAFYNPSTPQFPSQYMGAYFFGDYCNGWIRQFDSATGTVTGFATGISQPVDLKVGSDGSLYYLARGSGAVYKVSYTNQGSPQITVHPADQTVAVGQPATFTVSASGNPPLSYQWQRNGAPIPGATSPSYTLFSPALSDNGALFRCVVSNNAGSATSNSARLTVIGSSPPVGIITAPAQGTLYSAGETMNYSGTGTDAEDGTLPPSAFTWQVDFHHDTHIHPFLPPSSGSQSGFFTIPASGETSANVWYRIYLTVRDSTGLANTSYRDILPRKSTLSLETSPPGLQITLDGQPIAAPYSVVSVVGMPRTLGVVSPQTVVGVTYDFELWSDGGSATHNISTPATNTNYTAVYRPRSSPGSSPPAALSVTPNSGSGFSRAFSFLYSDPNGYTDLLSTQTLITGTGGAVSSCTTYYDRASNSVLLLNDANTGWLGPVTLGTASSLSNSQCTLNAGSSSASGAGSILTVKLAFTFLSTFAGSKTIYMYGRDAAGADTGWQARGTWTLISGNQPPSAVSLTPSSGSGSSQTYSFLYSDPNGYTDLLSTQTLITGTGSAVSSCTTYYDRASNSVLLLNDANTGWLGPVTLGTAGSLSNSQCTLNAGSSSASGAGSVLTVNLAFTFLSTFAGSKTIYMFARDAAGADTGGWQARGTWMVPGGNQPPSAVSVTPNSGSGANQTFSFLYSDPDGFTNLISTQTLITGTGGAVSSCTTYYDRASNSVLLLNDANTGWLGPVTLGAPSSLSNSQCTFNAGSSSASGAGNNLTVNLAFSFRFAFAGSKTIYVYARDSGGADTGWLARGTWIVP